MTTPLCGQALDSDSSRQNAIQQQVTLAQKLADSDATGALAAATFLCQDFAAMARQITSYYEPLEPTRVFDNLYFVGSEFVGAWILDSGDGLILFDSMGSSTEAARFIEGGLHKLGLRPDRIKYVVVTHGHWDHYGGARYLQTKYGARVVMGKADWDLLSHLPEQGPELMGQLPPKRDIAVDGPWELQLGSTTVRLIPTPGHSAGTLSALIPVRDGGQKHLLAMWGGTALPPTQHASEPEKDGTWHNLGLLQYRQSLLDFRQRVVEQGADGVVSTHPFSDGTLTRLKMLRNRSLHASHPFVLGQTLTPQYFSTIDHCVQGAILRAEQGGPAKKPVDK
jgi:metallo-beta-lactamase class B